MMTRHLDDEARAAIRRMRLEERRSYDFIGGRVGIPAHRAREVGREMGLPVGKLDRRTTP